MPQPANQTASKGPLAAWIACGGALLVLSFLFGTMVGDGGAAATQSTASNALGTAATPAGLPEGARQVDASEVPQALRDSAQPPGTGTRAPVQITPSAIDLGTLAPNVQVPAKAEIRNLGDKPLTIRSSRANCGCTAVDMAGTVIQPGRSVPLNATFNSQTNLGPRSANVTVLFEDYDEPVQVTITANVAS